jgi:hypothetical protein
VRRRELHDLKVLAPLIGVQPPSQALVKALPPLDITDGQCHDLEIHVDAEGALLPASVLTVVVALVPPSGAVGSTMALTRPRSRP